MNIFTQGSRYSIQYSVAAPIWWRLVALGLWFFSSLAQADHLHFSVLEDPAGKLTFNQVRDLEFTPITTDVLSFGLSNSTYWVKFDSSDITSTHELLYSCQTQLDVLDVYIPEGDYWRQVNVGTSRPFANRDIEHPCYLFDVAGVPDSEIYLRMWSDGIAKLALNLGSKQEFWQRQVSMQLMYGVYFALLAAILLYNFGFYWFTRDKVYLYCMGYLGGVALFLATTSGHASMYLWPNAVLWADIAPVALVSLAIACGLLCVKRTVASDSYSPGMAKWVLRVAPMAILIAVVNLFNGALAIILLGIFLVLALVLSFGMIAVSTFERYPPAYILAFAIIILLPAALAYFWHSVGWLKENDLLNIILYLTSSIEGLALTLALAYRERFMEPRNSTSAATKLGKQTV
ncbi:MAG: hypothetical protein HKN50_06045 [Gammaproteobacteria bacterium]|nr:hypothetical protein [Gammaproteobacteria bacterium]